MNEEEKKTPCSNTVREMKDRQQEQYGITRMHTKTQGGCGKKGCAWSVAYRSCPISMQQNVLLEYNWAGWYMSKSS